MFPVGGDQGDRQQTSSVIFGVLARWPENCIFCFAEMWWYMSFSLVKKRELSLSHAWG